MSAIQLRETLVITTLALCAGLPLACEPRVSVGNNSDTRILSIGFIPKDYDPSIFYLAYTGALDASAHLRVTNGRTVSVENLAPTQSTAEAQKAKLQYCIDKPEQGLIVSCADDGLSALIDVAVDTGIPVITFDSDCPGSKRLGFYGTDNAAAGAQAADLLAAALDGTAKRIAILSGNERADNLNARVDGFKGQLNRTYPGLELVKVFYCEETAESCKDRIENDILTQFPDLDGLFIAGFWGVQSACACESTNRCSCDASAFMPKWHAAKERGLKTVSFDALPFELELMRKGYLSALIGQQYYEWGYCTVERMFNHLTRGEPVQFATLGYDIINSEEKRESMWSKWVPAEKIDAGADSTRPPDCP